MNFSLIAAADKKLGIGKDNKLPWNLPGDLAYFNKITKGSGKNAIIMGRSTWESLPPKRRPLKDRLNIVLTHQNDLALPDGAFKASSLDDALKIAAQHNAEEVFVIGGAKVFAETIAHPSCHQIYLTEIDGIFECDTFFPHIDHQKFKNISAGPVQEENGIRYSFVKYKRLP
ncbi:MAG: dihydrofolate reductase [Patescibacteria group bacterium]